MEDVNLLKVIYFDEAFVADFLQIIAGGELKKTEEFFSELGSDLNAGLSGDVSVGTNKKVLPKLFSVFSGVGIDGKLGTSADLSYKRDRIVKNILENTLLSDFVSILKADERRSKNKRCKGIESFKNIKLRPAENSFTHLLLMAPYISLIDGKWTIDSEKEQQIDLKQIESAIEKGRGFYEFIGDNGGTSIILRLNRTAFRNNYTMSDIPKMELTYYAIKVGKISIDELSVSREFEFGMQNNKKRIDYIGESSGGKQTDSIDVYDVVLAGVVQD